MYNIQFNTFCLSVLFITLYLSLHYKIIASGGLYRFSQRTQNTGEISWWFCFRLQKAHHCLWFDRNKPILISKYFGEFYAFHLLFLKLVCIQSSRVQLVNFDNRSYIFLIICHHLCINMSHRYHQDSICSLDLIPGLFTFLFQFSAFTRTCFICSSRFLLASLLILADNEQHSLYTCVIITITYKKFNSFMLNLRFYFPV